jgi:hypothetical protein
MAYAPADSELRCDPGDVIVSIGPYGFEPPDNIYSVNNDPGSTGYLFRTTIGPGRSRTFDRTIMSRLL